MTVKHFDLVYSVFKASQHYCCSTGDIPRNTDAELWGSSDAMNLLFNLTYPSTLQGTQVNIVAAKLRLYKLSQVT